MTEQINGAELLEQIRAVLGRYVILPNVEASYW